MSFLPVSLELSERVDFYNDKLVMIITNKTMISGLSVCLRLQLCPAKYEYDFLTNEQAARDNHDSISHQSGLGLSTTSGLSMDRPSILIT